MSYRDKIGKSAYYINNNKIIKDIIVEGRETIHMNTGSDRHGKFLDPKVEYRFKKEEGINWHKAEDLFFSKEDIINAL